MANRKSNRAARRLFGAFGRLSNTRRITFRVLSDHWSCWRVVCVDRFKRSRSKKRRDRIADEIINVALNEGCQRAETLETAP